MFWNNKPQVTFDDIASPHIKATRLAIMQAADKLLKEAAEHATEGCVLAACEAHAEAFDLRALAISITLDMVETEARLTLIKSNQYGPRR